MLTDDVSGTTYLLTGVNELLSLTRMFDRFKDQSYFDFLATECLIILPVVTPVGVEPNVM
jgi:hypothetical protein